MLGPPVAHGCLRGNDLDFVLVTFAVGIAIPWDAAGAGLCLLVALCALTAFFAPVCGLWLFVQPIASLCGWRISFLLHP